MVKAMKCPNCAGVMRTLATESHYGREQVIDVCETCQMFWFDGLESLQLSSASVLQLFRLIGEADERARPRVLTSPPCPRCGLSLVRTVDQQRQSTFEYRRCPEGHGRLTTFYSFLREKDFIKPMSQDQVQELRTHLRSVNCSNCGAPVELRQDATCPHCKSQLSMLEVNRANAASAALARWLS